VEQGIEPRQGPRNDGARVGIRRRHLRGVLSPNRGGGLDNERASCAAPCTHRAQINTIIQQQSILLVAIYRTTSPCHIDTVLEERLFNGWMQFRCVKVYAMLLLGDSFRNFRVERRNRGSGPTRSRRSHYRGRPGSLDGFAGSDRNQLNDLDLAGTTLLVRDRNRRGDGNWQAARNAVAVLLCKYALPRPTNTATETCFSLGSL
jgi:hypothetical protein